MKAKDIKAGKEYRLAGQEAWSVRVVEVNGASVEVELLQRDGTPTTNEKPGDCISVSARDLSPLEVAVPQDDQKVLADDIRRNNVLQPTSVDTKKVSDGQDRLRARLMAWQMGVAEILRRE